MKALLGRCISPFFQCKFLALADYIHHLYRRHTKALFVHFLGGIKNVSSCCSKGFPLLPEPPQAYMNRKQQAFFSWSNAHNQNTAFCFLDSSSNQFRDFRRRVFVGITYCSTRNCKPLLFAPSWRIFGYPGAAMHPVKVKKIS